LKVRVYGDAAVANYIFTQSGNRQTGPYTNRQSRYTDVWVRRSGAWQVVATHGSNITPPLSPATTSAAAAWAKAATAQPTEKDAQELVRYEIEWGSLIGEKGLAFMERIEADDYLYTDGAGRLYTKAQDIAAAREREGSGNTREMRDIKVSFYGDVAVLTALFHDKVKDKGGAKDGYVRGTDVWLKRNGAWQCVAAHGSDLPTSSTNKPANKP
jgi:ketosteroid isomerase-like protein